VAVVAYPLDNMQVCTSLQTELITMPVHHHSVFTGRMPFLPPNQQFQSTEGKSTEGKFRNYVILSIP